MRDRRPRLDGKVAIVTGAGASGPGVGIGRAISTIFAREGARVLLVDLVAGNAEQTVAAIRQEGGEASVFVGDVTRATDCQSMVQAALEHYRGLHILVNNVGITSPGTAVDLEEEEWDRVLDVNLKSMMLASKYAVPKMIEGGGGSIINLSSISALRARITNGTVAYAASKGAVISLTTSMAASHGRDNVRVNCLLPGYAYTPMVAGRLTEEQRELRQLQSALGTEGTAWDVAWAAVFLASDEARWISGIALPVDAGTLVLTPPPSPPGVALP